ILARQVLRTILTLYIGLALYIIDRNEVNVLEIYGFSGRGREVRQVKCLLQEMQSLQVMKVEIEADENKKLGLINQLVSL
ncbi:unnamed protein product, partial [Arabidopsis halleri]